MLKEKDKNLDGADIREGIAAIVSVRIPEEILQFEGQTKGKLGTSEARTSQMRLSPRNCLYFLEENAELECIACTESDSCTTSTRGGT